MIRCINTTGLSLLPSLCLSLLLTGCASYEPRYQPINSPPQQRHTSTQEFTNNAIEPAVMPPVTISSGFLNSQNACAGHQQVQSRFRSVPGYDDYGRYDRPVTDDKPKRVLILNLLPDSPKLLDYGLTVFTNRNRYIETNWDLTENIRQAIKPKHSHIGLLVQDTPLRFIGFERQLHRPEPADRSKSPLIKLQTYAQEQNATHLVVLSAKGYSPGDSTPAMSLAYETPGFGIVSYCPLGKCTRSMFYNIEASAYRVDTMQRLVLSAGKKLCNDRIIANVNNTGRDISAQDLAPYHKRIAQMTVATVDDVLTRAGLQ